MFGPVAFLALLPQLLQILQVIPAVVKVDAALFPLFAQVSHQSTNRDIVPWIDAYPINVGMCGVCGNH
jgi:hypothetical protein